MKTLIKVWKWSGLWRWRETRVCSRGFSTPWVKVWAYAGHRRDLMDTRPRFYHTPEVDWSAVPQATHHRLVLDRLFVLIVVPHDNWLWRYVDAVHGAATERLLEWNWDSGAYASLCPFTPRQLWWNQRRIYLRTAARRAVTYWTDAWFDWLYRSKRFVRREWVAGVDPTQVTEYRHPYITLLSSWGVEMKVYTRASRVWRSYDGRLAKWLFSGLEDAYERQQYQLDDEDYGRF